MGSIGQNLCSKLNTTSYPKLWIKSNESESNAFSAIASSSGATKDMKMVFQENYTNSATALVLQSTTTLSSDPVEKFLAGTNIVNQNSGPLNLNNAILKRGTTPVAIYEYLYGNIPFLNVLVENIDTNLNNSSITTFNKSIGSVVDAFMNDSLLIKQSEIYNSSVGSGKPDVSSLLRLYDAGEKITTTQQALKTTLEQRNLRFFAAFIMEYCFYRTRYHYLLAKYFEAFQDTTATRTYTMIPTPSEYPVEFPIPVGEVVTKQEENRQHYMIRLAYHMSVCNIVMTDMRKLLKHIQTRYTNIFEQIRTALQSDSTIGSSDSAVRNSIMALQSSSEKLKTMVHESEFRKAALEYNAEKNRYGSMLLGLYAILNLSALAMIYKLR